MLNLEGGPSIPDQLAKLCGGCAVSLDWGKRSVKIAVDDQNTLNLIIRKLRRVEELFKRAFEPATVHLVHTENKSRFVLRLIALDKQRATGKERTTVFDSSSHWRSYPTSILYTVRLLDYDDATRKYKPCTIETKLVHSAYSAEKEHRDWSGYKFHSHKPTPLAPTPTDDAPKLANRHIAPEDLICTYVGPPAGALAEAAILLDPEDPTAPPRMEKAKRHPRPTGPNAGTAAATSSQDLASPETSGDEPSSLPRHGFVFDLGPTDPSDGSGEPPGVTMRPRQQSPAQTTTAPPPSSAGGLNLGARPPGRDEPPAQSSASRRPRERRTAHVPEPSTPTADNEPGSPSGAGFLLGPRPAAEAPEPVEAATVRPNRRPRERKALADDDMDAPDVSVESISEAHTRRVLRGASQKTPNPALNRAENIRRHNTERISTTFSAALENARGWRGELKLEAHLGRLVFRDIPRQTARSELEWSQWDALMSSLSPSLKARFTRILTTQHFDIEFIRDLKHSGGETMFSKEPISSRVTYEFELSIKKKKMLLSIDGETFEPKLYGEKRMFGTVNVANPLRLWDYSIDLTGSKPFELDSHPFIKAIYDSLSCAVRAELPVLEFTVDGPSLSVERVLLKLETRHNVYLERLHPNVPLELVMTEVQNLLLKCNPNVRTQFRAVALPKPDMRVQGRLHWTCSILPIDTNALLQENVKLEVGEISNWTPGEALKLGGEGGVSPSIVDVLNQIIPKIDNVGSTNKVV